MLATLRVEQPDPGTPERDHAPQRLQQLRGAVADRAAGRRDLGRLDHDLDTR